MDSSFFPTTAAALSSTLRSGKSFALRIAALGQFPPISSAISASTNAGLFTRNRVTLDRTSRYALRLIVIKSFADKRTAAIFAGYAIRDLPHQIQRRARARLLAIDAATQLEDLRVPPGNRLEALRGNRLGQYSMRINNQWRVCFIWRDNEAWDVEIVDYH